MPSELSDEQKRGLRDLADTLSYPGRTAENQARGRDLAAALDTLDERGRLLRRGHLADLEVVEVDEQQLEAAERAWWKRYANRLTPDERERISGEGAGKGEYRSFFRKYRPTFKAGDWLEVSPSHRVQIAEVQARRGRYRCIIGKVRDERSPGPRLKTRQRREDGVTETEPEGVDVRWLNRFRDEAAVKRAQGLREAIEGG